MEHLIIVIFGASGDLAKRKLMPALYSLYIENRLPKQFSILGIGRTQYSDDGYISYILEQMNMFVKDNYDTTKKEAFCKHLKYLVLDPSAERDYKSLENKLLEIKTELTQGSSPNSKENILYYLATPPSLYGLIPQYLKKFKLNGKGTRIIVEKPFGYDKESAHQLNKIYGQTFLENQVYRIDHFLGKETAQNILALRFSNAILEPVWNRNYIDYVEITAAENLGIENRGGFYDKTGALRDMVQNHLIQLVALTAMEPPAVFNADNFRNEVVKVYDSLKPLSYDDIKNNVIRAQYTQHNNKKGYKQENGIAPNSCTETFVAMKIGIDNWRWSGVPFYIRTGKQMATKVSEIIIHFKKAPFQMFGCDKSNCVGNELVIRLQPNEGILLRFGMKIPGKGFKIKQVAMDFSYNDLGGNPVGDAYARLLEDCILGDTTLFTRSDAVEASWRFFDPILQFWKDNPNTPMYEYKAGSSGPKEANILMQGTNFTWSETCKNLVNADKYCEL